MIDIVVIFSNDNTVICIRNIKTKLSHDFSRPSRICDRLPSVVVVCTKCIVAKGCVLDQKLLLTAYRKAHMRNPKWMTLTFV